MQSKGVGSWQGYSLHETVKMLEFSSWEAKQQTFIKSELCAFFHSILMETEFSQGCHNLLKRGDIKVGAVAAVQLYSAC